MGDHGGVLAECGEHLEAREFDGRLADLLNEVHHDLPDILVVVRRTVDGGEVGAERCNGEWRRRFGPTAPELGAGSVSGADEVCERRVVLAALLKDPGCEQAVT